MPPQCRWQHIWEHFHHLNADFIHTFFSLNSNTFLCFRIYSSCKLFKWILFFDEKKNILFALIVRFSFHSFILLQFCQHFLLKTYHIQSIFVHWTLQPSPHYFAFVFAQNAIEHSCSNKILFINFDEWENLHRRDSRFAVIISKKKMNYCKQSAHHWIIVVVVACSYHCASRRVCISIMNEYHKFSNWACIFNDPDFIKQTKRNWRLCCALLRISLCILRLMTEIKMATMIRFLQFKGFEFTFLNWNFKVEWMARLGMSTMADEWSCV